MIFQHTHELVLSGKKTQTRRKLGKSNYEVGRTYAVQPGRGMKSIGRIRIVRKWYQDPFNIGEEDARKEGFESRQAFLHLWERMHGRDSLFKPCLCLEFELVKDGEES